MKMHLIRPMCALARWVREVVPAALFLVCCAPAAAQLNVFTGKGLFYTLPVPDSIPVAGERLVVRHGGEELRLKPTSVDSLTFGPVDFRNAHLYIETTDGAPVVSKEEWKTARFRLDGGTLFADFSCEGRIRGRGNSTWEWYGYGGDPLIYGRRPYKVKFAEGQKPLGLKRDKTWVLLANWRDGSLFMNAFAFELGRYLGFAFTPHVRFCEVSLNGQYAGLYQLCEQIQADEHRVDIGLGDVLLALDADDGPALSPGAGDNFWSATYRLPVCIKYPKDEELTDSAFQAIRADFNAVEALVQRAHYDEVATRVDLPSLIDFLIVQELTDNVELDAPRSMYVHRTSDGIWHFGPLWDFDAGFAFDWGDMYRGHTYFGDQTLMYGTDPAHAPNRRDGTRFFLAMFADARFTAAYKARWAEVKDSLVTTIFARLDNYRAQLDDALARNTARWPIYRDATYNWWGERTGGEPVDTDREYERLRAWITRRIRLMTTAINKYPE